MFTTRLLNTLNSFLPSVVDPVLKRDCFAVLATIKDLDLSHFNTTTQAQRNAAKILADLQALHQTTRDIFTYDNTNTIESFFNVVKGRTPKDSPRLIDIYNAVSFTETQSLARHNPVSPSLPQPLVASLLHVLSPDTLNVMTKEGVESFLELLIQTSVDVLTERTIHGVAENEIELALSTGRRIEGFRRMPCEWVMSQRDVSPSHLIVHVQDVHRIPLDDVVMFLEPFFDLATRSVPVFELLHNALLSLHELANEDGFDNNPITFQFLTKKFKRFVTMAEENGEMVSVFCALCNALETLKSKDPQPTEPQRRVSIADPGVVRVFGPRTTSTSAKVDHTAVPPHTKMVEALRASKESGRKPRPAAKRKIACKICNGHGHQARTCPDVLAEANRERADAFFRRLVADGKVDAYLAGVAKRATIDSAQAIADRIRTPDAGNVARPELQGLRQP